MAESVKKSGVGLSVNGRYPLSVEQSFRAADQDGQAYAAGQPVYEGKYLFGGGLVWITPLRLSESIGTKFGADINWFRTDATSYAERLVSQGDDIDPRTADQVTSEASHTIDGLDWSLTFSVEPSFGDGGWGLSLMAGLNGYHADVEAAGILPGDLVSRFSVSHLGPRIGGYIFFAPAKEFRILLGVERKIYFEGGDVRGEAGERIQVKPPSGTFPGIQLEVIPAWF